MEAVIPRANDAPIDVEVQEVAVRRKLTVAWRRSAIVASAFMFVVVACRTTSAGETTLSALNANVSHVATVALAAAAEGRASIGNHAAAIRQLKSLVHLEGYLSMLNKGHSMLPKLQSQEFHLPALPKFSQLSTMNVLNRNFDLVKETAKTSSHAILTFSAESAELAWETSESLLQHLSTSLTDRHGIVEEETKDENAFTKALEGIALHLRGKKWENSGDNVVVKDEGKVNSRRQGGTKRDHRRGNRNQGQGERIKRRLSVQEEHVNFQFSDTKEGSNILDGVISTFSDSSVSTILLAFSCLAVLAAFVSNQVMRARRRHRDRPLEGRSIILDEEEAEIVEFYEKEMESGTLFAFNDSHEEEEGDDYDVDVDFGVRHEGGLGLRDELLGLEESGSLCDVTPNPKLYGYNRHDSRESNADSYYSRVLQDIETLGHNVDDDDENDLIEESSCCEDSHTSLLNGHCCVEMADDVIASDDGACDLNECYELLTPLEAASPSDAGAIFDQEDGSLEEQVLDPQSPSSSISSLTNESFTANTETTPLHYSVCSHEIRKEISQAMNTGSEFTSPIRHTIVSPPPPLPELDQGLSSVHLTPVRSNVCRLQHEINCDLPEAPPLRRRVSFSPDVEVHFPVPEENNADIRSMPSLDSTTRKNNEKSLYMMLLTVGIAIAMVSFLPSTGIETVSSIIKNGYTSLYRPSESSSWSVEL